MENLRRGRLITFRCNEKEELRIKRVAKYHKLGVAALIRMLVKKAAQRIKRKKLSPPSPVPGKSRKASTPKRRRAR